MQLLRGFGKESKMKSKLKWNCAFGSSLAIVVVLGANAYAEDAATGSWDLTTGVAVGSACDQSNTGFFSVGGKLMVSFSGLAISLPAAPPGAKTKIVTCNVAVKANFSSPVTSIKTHEDLSWKCTKSGNSGGALGLASRMCGVSNLTFARCGQNLNQVISVVTPAVSECLYVAHIGMAAWTKDADSSIVLVGENVQLDVGYDE